MSNKLKSLLVLVLLILFGSAAYCQQPEIKELKVGDKVPAIILTKLIRSTHRSVKLSDMYRNGLLIIDFWATWCVPCIKEIKTADSLAGKHKALSFLSVSIDDSLNAASFLNRHPEISTKNIMVTADDKLLSRYFKHSTIPHNVWIDRRGIVRLISESDAVNEKNILSYLKPK